MTNQELEAQIHEEVVNAWAAFKEVIASYDGELFDEQEEARETLQMTTERTVDDFLETINRSVS